MKMCKSAGLSKPSLAVYGISTNILCAGLFDYIAIHMVLISSELLVNCYIQVGLQYKKEPNHEVFVLITYSKTCLKGPLKNRQNKHLNDKC